MKFICTTFYRYESVYGMKCKKYVQKQFREKHNFVSALSFLVCARLMTCVRAQLIKGTLEQRRTGTQSRCGMNICPAR